MNKLHCISLNGLNLNLKSILILYSLEKYGHKNTQFPYPFILSQIQVYSIFYSYPHYAMSSYLFMALTNP